MAVSSILKMKGRDVVPTSPDQTIASAATVLADRRIGSLVVIDKAGALVGILSERDIVRAVQQARRDAGLDVSDRISLTLGLDEPTAERVRSYLEYVAGETLATSLVIDGSLPRTIEAEDVTIGVALERLP